MSIFKTKKAQVFEYSKKDKADNLKKLLEKKIKSDKQKQDYLNQQNSSGQSPLIVAALNHAHGSAEVLLENGANVEVWTKQDGSALHVASKKEDYKMVNLLVQYGANPFIEDSRGWTSLDWVSRKKDRRAWKIMESFFKQALAYGFLDMKVAEKGKNAFEQYLCLLFYRDSYRDIDKPNPCELNTPQLTLFAFNCGDVKEVGKSGAPKTKFGWVRTSVGFVQQKLNQTIIQKEKNGVSGKATTAGVSYVTNFAARKIATTAFKGAIRVNVISWILLMGVEQGLKMAPVLDDEELKILMEQIPVKPPEEVIVLNEADFDFEKHSKGKGQEGLQPGDVIKVSLHPQHRKLSQLHIENLDVDKHKEYEQYIKNKNKAHKKDKGKKNKDSKGGNESKKGDDSKQGDESMKSESGTGEKTEDGTQGTQGDQDSDGSDDPVDTPLAHDLAQGKDEQYVVYFRVPEVDNGFANGVVQEVGKAPQQVYIQDEGQLVQKKKSPYTGILQPVEENSDVGQMQKQKMEEQNAEKMKNSEPTYFGSNTNNPGSANNEQLAYDPMRTNKKKNK